MGIEVTCDGCNREADGDIFCDRCATIKTRGTSVEDLAEELGDLASAIRRGDRDEAEHLLDRIASAVPGWSDRVEIGRYAPRARAA